MEDKDLQAKEASSSEEVLSEIAKDEAPDEPAEVDEIASLRQDLAQKQEEAAKNHDQYLRAMAEVENVKKRSSREREEYIKFATVPLIKKLLPVIDDFDRALLTSNSQQDYEALRKGVEMIAKNLDQLLINEGVEVVEALGKPFDPQYHQPLAVEANSEEPENTVVEELQKGYIMRGRLIRPALVKVSGS